MKKYIVFTIIALSLILAYSINLCFADVYVIYKKDTGEVYTASEKNDTVISEDCKIEILPGNFKDYTLEYPITDYKIKNKKFIANIDKISKQELAREEKIKKDAEEVLIQERIRKIAIDQLKAEGKIK